MQPSVGPTGNNRGLGDMLQGIHLFWALIHAQRRVGKKKDESTGLFRDYAKALRKNSSHDTPNLFRTLQALVTRKMYHLF
jgi:hypothetical protein